MRKILIISIIIIALVLLGAGAYWYFFKKTGGPGEEQGFLGFFPFGKETDLEGNGGLEPGNENLNGYSESENLQLIQLSKSAVSGATAASTSIRYIEKAIGHIFEINPDGKNELRISNTTVLKTFGALWSTSGKNLLIKYFDDNDSAQNFSARFGSEAGKIEGIFLPEGIVSVAASPSEEKIFYMLKGEGEFFAATADFQNESKKTLFSLPVGEFNLSWPSKDVVVLLSRPSYQIDGFLYAYNIKTGIFEKLLGDIKGLTASLSPDARYIIYSASANKSISANIIDTREKKERVFELRTLPEKCVWSKLNSNIAYCAAPNAIPKRNYPDDWYKGKVSFDDAIWKIDVSSQEVNLLIANSDADVIQPFLTADEDYFVFINKKDNTLWSLKLKE